MPQLPALLTTCVTSVVSADLFVRCLGLTVILSRDVAVLTVVVTLVVTVDLEGTRETFHRPLVC